MSGAGSGTSSVPPATLAWLERELEQWQEEGRLDADTAAGIRARYTAGSRLPLARLMLLLGASSVGVGLIWLVAANLEDLSPAVRFSGVVLVWLAATAGAEVLAARRSGRGTVGAVRLLAAIAFGAVVFQAAQSLQVPAYEPRLLGAWAAGALLHAYAVRAVAPLLVAIAAGVGWYGWSVAERSESAAGAALALLLAGAVATAAAVVHGTSGPRAFAAPWRGAAALLTLGGLFVAALPRPAGDAVSAGALVWAGAAVAAGALAVAAVRAGREGRAEAAVGAAATVLGWLVLLWQPPGASSAADLTGEALLRTIVVVLLYLLVALWAAALGVLHGAPGLTRLATGALVLFVVVQSFAVFEPILSGAALFLALGAVLVASGFLVERGRRTLVATVQEAGA